MSGWNPFLRPTWSPARLFMGAVFAGVVPFSTAVQQAEERGG